MLHISIKKLDCNFTNMQLILNRALTNYTSKTQSNHL